MNELSLFTGAGGGIWGTHHLLGFRTVGYVEWDKYCQQVLAERIRDGSFIKAPIFSDIRAFNVSGYALRYQGMVDIITGGFPCQPFSVAGKQRAVDDERNMWPATIETIRQVRPRYAFLENAPGLLSASHGYFGTILRELAEIGYDAEWCTLSAAECGAWHKRERLWILAYANKIRGVRIRERQLKDHGSHKEEDANTERQRLEGVKQTRATKGANNRSIKGSDTSWWSAEPGVGRVVHRLPHRSNRIKALGNAQVPIVAATAFITLLERIDGMDNA